MSIHPFVLLDDDDNALGGLVKHKSGSSVDVVPVM